MRANRNVSKAELNFRRALWAAGARGFRRGTGLPGRPDIIFPAVRVAIFVNGCYWHRCPKCGLPQPRANAEFWREKFDQNVARDRRAAAALDHAGWKVVAVWEHELRDDLGAAAGRVADLIETERRT